VFVRDKIFSGLFYAPSPSALGDKCPPLRPHCKNEKHLIVICWELFSGGGRRVVSSLISIARRWLMLVNSACTCLQFAGDDGVSNCTMAWITAYSCEPTRTIQTDCLVKQTFGQCRLPVYFLVLFFIFIFSKFREGLRQQSLQKLECI